jgi:hypothetical protein
MTLLQTMLLRRAHENFAKSVILLQSCENDAIGQASAMLYRARCDRVTKAIKEAEYARKQGDDELACSKLRGILA